MSGVKATGSVELRGSYGSLSRLYDAISDAIDRVPGDHELSVSLHNVDGEHHMMIRGVTEAMRPKASPRCRILVSADAQTWACLSAGCGSSGFVAGGRVHESQRSIAVTDLPDHQHSPGDSCLFDQARKS
jgi:hypothetical protein